LYHAPEYNQHYFSLYQENYIPWFLTNDYQRWSMLNNNNGIKFGHGLHEYKLAAKKYIFKFDKNPYYFHYKYKMGSPHQLNPTYRSQLNKTVSNICALRDDGSAVTFDNIELVRETMLKHSNLLSCANM
jgi:hypothetical protein